MPKFSPMKPYKATQKLVPVSSMIYAVQPKINGMRALFYDGELHSSQGNVITCLPELTKALHNTSHSSNVLALDGELYAHGLRLQEILSITKRKELHSRRSEIKFVAFDIISDENQTYRLSKLDSIYNGKVHGAWVSSNEFKLVETGYNNILLCSYWWAIFDSLARQEEYIAKATTDSIAAGFEGIILRPEYGLYEQKKSKNLLKHKPLYQAWFEITNVRQAKDKNGVAKQELGSVECNDEIIGSTNNPEAMDYNVYFNVGTGELLNSSYRKATWINKQDLIGSYALVQFPERYESGIPHQPRLIDISSKPYHVEPRINFDLPEA